MRSIIAIQEGQLSLDQLKQLETVVRRVYAEHIGDYELSIVWTVADKKHTVTDRQWSRSSACTIAVPNGFPLDKRQTFLLALEGEWRAVTGQHPDQMSFSAFDEDNFKQVIKGNLARFSPLGRFLFLARTMFRVMQSKRKHGVMISLFNQ
ncbi:MAG: hypothetical protein OIF47_04835 [Marinibacterium sp.]|nr:hypothetical protein [Marinibacterium sp.]